MQLIKNTNCNMHHEIIHNEKAIISFLNNEEYKESACLELE
jgi:hypothetical protein